MSYFFIIYENRSGSQDPGFSNKKIEELFLKYVDPSVHTQEDPLMQPEGVENFLTDLGLEPEDVRIALESLVDSWVLLVTKSTLYQLGCCCCSFLVFQSYDFLLL